jgi:polysaccharide deacetylase 2 family uncharacterized protein YibQ
VVHAAPDDLVKPLGVERPRRRPAVSLPAGVGKLAARATAALLLGGTATIVGYVMLFGDPLGGDPYVVAPIVPHEAPFSGDGKAGDGSRGTNTAAELEQQAGVAVVRPGEKGPPGAVVITVPQQGPIKLAPAPDRRLVERTRYGLLPRIGPDGARAAAVYARPAEQLPGGAKPNGKIAIVVGGLGIGQSVTTEAIIKLLPAVTLAFAPYGTDLDGAVAKAREQGHEVLLQLPMQPFDYPDNDPGPHTLTVEAKPAENIDRLHRVMTRFTGYVGAINFMGAKFTSNDAALQPILKELGDRGLFFLDDGSSPRSLAQSTAQNVKATAARADAVVDAAQRADAIDKELEKLEALARERGLAIGVASALPLSIERIARWTKGLETKGLLLVPASAAIRDGRG